MKKRHAESNEADSKKPKLDSSAEDVAKLIAEKQSQVAVKLAQLTKPNTTSEKDSKKDVSDEIRRKMEEVNNRIKAVMAGQGQAGSKKGLGVELHPLFDSSAPDIATIRSMVPKASIATSKANQRALVPNKAAVLAKAKATAAIKKNLEREISSNVGLKLEHNDDETIKKGDDFKAPDEPIVNPYLENSFSNSGPSKRSVSKAFKFVPQGKYVAIGNKLRQEAVLEKLKADIAEKVKKSGMSAELEMKEPPPEVEWWDSQLLGSNVTYENYTADNPNLENTITDLIQHPIPIQPPAELGAPPPKPLMLTKKESKKLRRQTRAEAQKERIDKIRIGLLPPDQPKVKISNLMRVLGTEAVSDPTKIEAAVRAQIRQRKLKHEKYIAEHKLTKEQKRERNRLKLVENTHIIVEAAVFKVFDLSSPQHRFKVEVNAQQLFLTGVALLHPDNNLVVVEGGTRGIKQYKKLMLRRIDWGDNSAAENGDEDGEAPETSHNRCLLVWEGNIKQRLFQGFNVLQCPTPGDIKEVLGASSALHYWEAAKNFTDQVE